MRWPWSKKKEDPESLVEYPKIAKLQVVKRPCRICGLGLDDGALVVWFEKKNGWHSDLAHAECSVYIREEDGQISRLGPPPVFHGANLLAAGRLLLTRSEWEAWKNGAELVQK